MSTNNLSPEQHFDTHEKPFPVCPNCGHIFVTDEMFGHDVDMFALAPNEDSTCIDCPVCDKEFAVRGGYNPHYTSAFTEDELDFV